MPLKVGYELVRYVTEAQAVREETYKLVEVIREGTLFRFRNEHTKQSFVGKDFSKIESLNIFEASNETKRFQSLQSVHKQLTSVRNVLKVHCVLEDANHQVVLFPYLCNGSLKEVLNRRGRLTEVEIRSYGHRILRIVRDLEQIYILHKNLNLGHFLVDSEGELHIIDFTLAKQL
jgi:serine/threonine protein kinase